MNTDTTCFRPHLSSGHAPARSLARSLEGPLLLLVAWLAVFVLPVSGHAQSEAVLGASNGIGKGDVTPAATLLLPYFEVDTVDADGVNTRFWVNNARAQPTVANMVLWTDLGRPTLNIEIYLSGFDSVEIDLGALLRDGALPEGDPGLAPGGFSDVNVDFPNCLFPWPETMPGSVRTFLVAAHTGNPAPAGSSQAGLCAGVAWGDDVARGFITVDVVRFCTLGKTPLDSGYFEDGGTGFASNDNVIWGEYLIDRLEGSLDGYGAPLVHLEASGSVAEGTWESGDYTFYGKAVDATAVDNREPVATTWMVRYENDLPAQAQQTAQLLYWRDPFGTSGDFFTCADGLPVPFPLSAWQEVFFDDAESAVVVENSPFSPPPTPDSISALPYAAGRADLQSVVSVFDAGWVWLNLNTVVTGHYLNPYQQGFISVVYRRIDDLLQAGHQAVPVDNALVPNTATLGN